ncbi:hypothetical protein MA16_Dca019770 [Dendrobium catenatum]|uniref:Uncharacterized protein n=1 Tax=Dendrobium catenatum TaxID=906689 RepID=A0A2I0WC06_9ASPA|nr:hypothetical protein MA16_Dca019770 [Dendrobium catenatum]
MAVSFFLFVLFSIIMMKFNLTTNISPPSTLPQGFRGSSSSSCGRSSSISPIYSSTLQFVR